MKIRADLLLVKKKIANTRTKAQTMISDEQIYINEKKILKSGQLIDIKSNINCRSSNRQWVSRGAKKLMHAIDHFKINLNDFICLDIGASTGGFTEVLLINNAKKIYSVDVGTNQLHKNLLKNPKVINISKINAKYLNSNLIPDLVNIIVCDVSFISMKKVIKPSLPFLDKKNGIIIGLIKPQFELQKNEIPKSGIIKDNKIHEKICNNFKEWFTLECKMKVLGIIPSPITGSKGNHEFLIYAKRKS